ncbi:MAG: CBS domain-containing protein [bacterium]
MQKFVADYATFESLLTVDWNRTVNFALQRMKELNRSCLFVVDREGKTLGIVTEHDKPSDQNLKEFCEQREFKIISVEEAKTMNSRAAAKYMSDNKFHRITIKDKSSLGIFTSTDFIKMVAEGN